MITRGDYLEDFMTIYLENNTDKDIGEIYETLVLQCGSIQKFYQPVLPIKVSLNEQDSLKLQNTNVAYLAGITKDGHKETFNGSVTFNTRGEVVFYEPPASTIIPSGTSESSCDCKGIKGYFSTCRQPAIKAYFVMNWKPEKLSQLQNDTDFQDSIQVAESISIHNASTEAHPYIQSALASATEALTVSIQAETTAREEAVSLAISTTEAYADSIVTQATEATRAYADSIVSTATTATEAYTDSVLQSATTAINTTIGDLSQLDTSVKSSVTNAINAEVSARQGADNNLQTQIDGLAAASDVTDIVGTYAELQAYDTSHLNNNDIIKVLSDSTHNNQPSYYRYNKSTDTFSYIGSESASYTKAQSDSIFVTQTTEINGHALSSDINLTASDVGALSDSYATVISANTSAIATNTSAIASNTSVIAQHTTAIASNTSDISTINGKIPTDASTTNKLVSASTLSASISDFANKGLSNLTSNGEARLHALKSYADEGELLTDADGLSFVKNYAHSTFDRSKFTVVGSPNITDDGIASGFSGSDYLQANAQNFTQSITFRARLKTPKTLPNAQQGVMDLGGDNTGIKLSYSSYYQKFYLNISTSGTSIAADVINYAITNDAWYDLIFEFTGTKYNVYIKSLSESNFTLGFTATDSRSQLNGTSYLGYVNNLTSMDFIIDLKQFSITVDGVPVFSGNRTGIDTIKPDNYTVVGAPTISADGIASGFSSSNYIITDYQLDMTNANSWVIIAKVNPGTFSNQPYQAIYAAKNSGGSNREDRFGFQGTGKLNLLIGFSDNSMVNFDGNKVFTANEDVFVKAEFTGSAYNTYYSYDGINWTLDGTASSSQKGVNRTRYIGTTTISGFEYLFRGSIDLNAFKIYVDGNLVYQSCLKIPYTESKTGSKIVNSVCRDRVNDMAEQFGYANYYTLDEDNGNFTLPQVELYGLIGQRTLRDSYRNGINYWELYSNRDLEQGGSCTSGVEVTFARPFADTNYVLSVPYSAKSSTAFTPTQTSDWIAKGKGLL